MLFLILGAIFPYFSQSGPLILILSTKIAFKYFWQCCNDTITYHLYIYTYMLAFYLSLIWNQKQIYLLKSQNCNKKLFNTLVPGIH